jgi:hypothetical protein
LVGGGCQWRKEGRGTEGEKQCCREVGRREEETRIGEKEKEMKKGYDRNYEEYGWIVLTL